MVWREKTGKLILLKLSSSYWAVSPFSKWGGGGWREQQTASLDLEKMTTPCGDPQLRNLAGSLRLIPVLYHNGVPAQERRNCPRGTELEESGLRIQGQMPREGRA